MQILSRTFLMLCQRGLTCSSQEEKWRYKQMAAAKKLFQQKRLASVLPFGLLHSKLAGIEETGQTTSHQRVGPAEALLVALVLVFGEEFVVVEDCLFGQQHSVVAQLMLWKTLVA